MADCYAAGEMLPPDALARAAENSPDVAHYGSPILRLWLIPCVRRKRSARSNHLRSHSQPSGCLQKCGMCKRDIGMCKRDIDVPKG